VDTKSIPKTTKGRERLVKIESTSRPGLVHRVDLAAGTCSCEATVEVCRHIRIARIRAAKKTKVCRQCGGYGRFLWGFEDHGECGACGGTGRAA
jgi:hypothetical protein